MNGLNLNKMYNDKIWDELLAYSQVEFPIDNFKELPEQIRPNKKEVAFNEYNA